MTEYRLISSDSHVTIPDDTWQTYLDPEFRDRAPRIEHTDDGDVRVFEGKRTPIMTLDNLAGKKPEEFKLNVRKLDEQRAGAGDPVERVKDMDIDGVDAEVLYVGGPLQSSDPALRLNSVRGYNRWLSDYASYAPGRLLGVAAIPIDTPERAVEELEFAATQPGLVSGYIPLFPPDGDYGDPKWDPMWEAFLATGFPVGLHVGGRRPGTPVVNMYERHPIHDRPRDEQADDGGIGVGAHPRPRVAALPGAQVRRGRRPDRMDLVLRVLLRPPLGEAPVLDREQARGATEPLFPATGVRHLHGGPGRPAGAPQHRDRQHHVGERLPHSETTWPDSKALTDEWFTQFGEDDKRKILWANAARLYQLT